MATQVESELHSGEVTTLVNGIIEDARRLLMQQLTLFQVELKNDLRKTLEASIPIALGGLCLLVAMIVLCISASFLLCWIWPELPYWGGFGIIGGLITVAGVALIAGGLLKFDRMNPPAEKAVEGLKENLQWKTKT